VAGHWLRHFAPESGDNQLSRQKMPEYSLFLRHSPILRNVNSIVKALINPRFHANGGYEPVASSQ